MELKGKLQPIIYRKITSEPEGTIFSPGEFSNHGTSRQAVSWAFKRLCNKGIMFRIDAGMYVAGVETPEGRRPPSVISVLSALSELRNSPITKNEENSALSLGLIGSSSNEDEFLIHYADREITIGERSIYLRHVPYWKVAFGNSVIGDAIRAIDWFGESVAYKNILKLRTILSKDDWLSLILNSNALPSWIHQKINLTLIESSLLNGDEKRQLAFSLHDKIALGDLFGALEIAQSLLLQGIERGEVSRLLGIHETGLIGFLRLLKIQDEIRLLWDHGYITDKYTLSTLGFIYMKDVHAFNEIKARILDGEKLSQVEAVITARVVGSNACKENEKVRLTPKAHALSPMANGSLRDLVLRV